ncbi:hypothetical protein IMZ48_17530 [Candidatus Bathyarchaeota archaeon]|nr:hypothetical protein [Candidatus Bathyarchaeota archaeon]
MSVSDKLTQNEIEELEGTLENTSQQDTSLLRDLLENIPSGIFGGENESEKVQEIQANASSAQEEMQVSPKEPEEFTRYVQDIFKQIMPAIEWHDGLVKNINNATDKIPILHKIMEQLSEELSTFIFSVIAPFILPVLRQIRSEMKTGSDEIIASSEKEQHVVFNDDSSTDPTHSMLAKDHFSNVSLVEPAGLSWPLANSV